MDHPRGAGQHNAGDLGVVGGAVAILEIFALWFVISAIVGLLLGMAIHRIDHDASLPNGSGKRDVLLSGNHDSRHGPGD